MKLFIFIMTLIAVSYGGFYYLLVINGGPSSANSQETLRASAEALAENPKVAEAFASKSSSKITPAKIQNRSPASEETLNALPVNEHFILEQDIMRNVEDSNKGALRKEYLDAPEKTLERIQVVLRSPNVREQFDSYKNLMEYSVDIAEYSKSPEIKNLIVQELNSRFQLIRGQSEIETAHLFLWKQKIEQIEENNQQ